MERYIWVDLKDIPEFGAMIAKEGGDHLRLRIYTHPKHEGDRLELSDVETGEVCGSYNFSHTCPPDCP